jgi:predicted metal-dependent peptidase
MNDIELQQSYSAVKLYLSQKVPLAYSLLQNCEVVFTESAFCKTACVTPKDKIYVNKTFWAKLKLLQRAFLLVHETFHPAFDYFLRSTYMVPNVANQAHDYVINLMIDELIEGGFIQGGLLDKRFENHSFERVYDILMEEQPEQGGSNGQGGGFPSGSGDETDSRVFGDENMMNDAMRVDVIGKGAKGDAKAGESGESGEAVSVEELKEASDKWRMRLSRALEFSDMQNGTIPGRLRETIEFRIGNRVDWTKQLRLALGELFGKARPDYSRFHRRTGWGGHEVVMPAEKFSQIDVAVYFDTSGSISQKQLSRGFSECHELCEKSGGNIRLLTGDAEIVSDEYIDEMPEDVGGGGGTSFVPIFDHLYAYPEKSKGVVIFTDTWGEMPEFPPDIQVYWAVYEECFSSGIQVPFGEVIKIPCEND